MLCEHDTRYDGEQLVNNVGNNISAKGEGRREPFSCSLRRGGPNRQGSRPSVVTEKPSPIVTGCTDKVVHRSVYLSRELSLLRRVTSEERLNKPLEEKRSCLIEQNNVREEA